MGVEESTDRAKKKSLVKVTVEVLGPTTSIDEEWPEPEGVLDGQANEVLQSITPTILCGPIHQHESVSEAVRDGAITIANVSTDGSMQGSFPPFVEGA
jgi:hypothetical protein